MKYRLPIRKFRERLRLIAGSNSSWKRGVFAFSQRFAQVSRSGRSDNLPRSNIFSPRQHGQQIPLMNPGSECSHDSIRSRRNIVSPPPTTHPSLLSQPFPSIIAISPSPNLANANGSRDFIIRYIAMKSWLNTLCGVSGIIHSQRSLNPSFRFFLNSRSMARLPKA